MVCKSRDVCTLYYHIYDTTIANRDDDHNDYDDYDVDEDADCSPS